MQRKPAPKRGRPRAPVDFADRLRTAIFEGRYLPNQRLTEEELAEFLGTNRGNVRAALAKLEQQGLVVLGRNRGSRVRMVAPDEAVEIAEARAMLERALVREATLNATEDDIAELRTLLAEIDDGCSALDFAEYVRSSHRLHEAIARMADNAVIERLLSTLRSLGVTFNFRSVLIPGRMHESAHEHHDLVAAIAARDPDAAEESMRKHLDESTAALRKVIAMRQASPIANYGSFLLYKGGKT